MEESRTYLCNKCGREHEGWPALAYTAPVFYDNLSEEEKQEIGELDKDFCMIRHEDQTGSFWRRIIHAFRNIVGPRCIAGLQ
ncbi:MAG: DUF2199 domain-containing protein [Chitinophagaceae bacterium]|nr:DUF2199 domain-containing protein [Chitinophagaceae bacterium]